MPLWVVRAGRRDAASDDDDAVRASLFAVASRDEARRPEDDRSQPRRAAEGARALGGARRVRVLARAGRWDPAATRLSRRHLGARLSRARVLPADRVHRRLGLHRRGGVSRRLVLRVVVLLWRRTPAARRVVERFCHHERDACVRGRLRRRRDVHAESGVRPARIERRAATHDLLRVPRSRCRAERNRRGARDNRIRHRNDDATPRRSCGRPRVGARCSAVDEIPKRLCARRSAASAKTRRGASTTRSRRSSRWC